MNDRKSSKPGRGLATRAILVSLFILTSVTLANAGELWQLTSDPDDFSYDPSSGPKADPSGPDGAVRLRAQEYLSQAIQGGARLSFADKPRPAFLSQPLELPEPPEFDRLTSGARQSPSPSIAPGEGDLLTYPGANSTDSDTEPSQPAQKRQSVKAADDQIEKAGCSSCGGFHSSADGSIFHNSMGGALGQCVPGQEGCTPPGNECDTLFGAIINNVYEILNCNDPCYQPVWDPAAYASVFADYARPRTVTRFRYDNIQNLVLADRNTYFLMQTNSHFPSNFTNRHGVPYRTDPSVMIQQGYYYQEAAAGRGSVFFELPYRSLDPLYSPGQAGFGDINFGIKSLLLDTELLQVSFQFRTYTPSGNAAQGLGTGHFTLDPSLLSSLKLAPDTFLQLQLGNWTPLGGNPQTTGQSFTTTRA